MRTGQRFAGAFNFGVLRRRGLDAEVWVTCGRAGGGWHRRAAPAPVVAPLEPWLWVGPVEAQPRRRAACGAGDAADGVNAWCGAAGGPKRGGYRRREDKLAPPSASHCSPRHGCPLPFCFVEGCMLAWSNSTPPACVGTSRSTCRTLGAALMHAQRRFRCKLVKNASNMKVSAVLIGACHWVRHGL